LQAPSALGDRDVAAVVAHCSGRLTPAEVGALYARFRRLDRSGRGWLTRDEVSSVPEIAICPLGGRVSALLAGVNFAEWCWLVSALSRRATRRDRLDALFRVLDVDGDGAIGLDDLRLIVGMRGGEALSEEEREAAAREALAWAGGGVERDGDAGGGKEPQGLTPRDLERALREESLEGLMGLHLELGPGLAT